MRRSSLYTEERERKKRSPVKNMQRETVSVLLTQVNASFSAPGGIIEYRMAKINIKV